MVELNYAAEMAKLQHEDRLRRAEKSRRYRESKTERIGWLARLQHHLRRNR